MAISTQRLLIWICIINLLMSTAIEIWSHPDPVQANVNTKLDNEVTILTESGSKLEDTQSLQNPYSTSATFGDPTFGNSILMFGPIMNIFLRGLVPFISIGTVHTVPEQIIMYGLNVLKGYITIMLALELYFVLKNHKWS